MTNKMINFVGTIIGLGFTITFLFLWIIRNLQGYEIVTFTEPNLTIKYIEWIVGLVGIIIISKMLIENIQSPF